MDISTREITSKNVRGNNLGFSAIEITAKKVCGNNVDFSIIEITLIKLRGNNVDFSTSEITSKKVRGNEVDFSISKITSKKSWKWREYLSKFCLRRIDVISTLNRRGFDVVCSLGWNPSNCKCECDKSCDIGDYLDYENCKCRKKLIDKLVEECTETNNGVKIAKITLAENENKHKRSSCTLYTVLFSIIFTIKRWNWHLFSLLQIHEL